MQTFLRKINEYTTLEAIKLPPRGPPLRASDLTVRPVWTFVKLYLGKQGFRDGLEGLGLLRPVGPLGRRPALEAPRADRAAGRAS